MCVTKISLWETLFQMQIVSIVKRLGFVIYVVIKMPIRVSIHFQAKWSMSMYMEYPQHSWIDSLLTFISLIEGANIWYIFCSFLVFNKASLHITYPPYNGNNAVKQKLSIEMHQKKLLIAAIKLDKSFVVMRVAHAT